MARTTALNKIQATLYEPTFYKIIQGGMSAGKTYAILQLLIGYADSYPESRITVIGKSVPHLKDGAMTDFKNIMKECEYWEEGRWNTSNSEYRFACGSIIQFRSIDKMGAHGPRRDVLFVNEANALSYDTFDQLASRTRDFVIIDYNPSSEFWAHKELVEKRANECSFEIVTYKDNEALGEQERKNIEVRAPKKGEEPSNWWVVYGLGQIGSLEGNVYSGWAEDSAANIKDNGQLIRYGLDFGFSNDETALVAVYDMGDGKLGLVEQLYKTGMLGSQYADAFKRLGVDTSVLIVADSARPEIIAEIKKGGFRCIGADKNAGSVLRGIDRVSQRQITYAGDNLKREYLSYAWRTKRSGEITDEPEDKNNHLMDALRYAIDDLDRPRFDF